MSSFDYFSCLGSWHFSDVPEEALMNPKRCSDATQWLSNSHSHSPTQNSWGWWRELAPGVPVILPKTPLGHRHLNTSLQFSAERRSKETIRNWQHPPALTHSFSEGCVVAQTQNVPAVAQRSADNNQLSQARGNHPLGLLRSWVLVKQIRKCTSHLSLALQKPCAC